MNNVIFKNKGYQIPRENRCCVCGSIEELTRHHLIPECYSGKVTKKKELKKQLLDMHQYYFEWDYCCICKKCHRKYESEWAQALHEEIWNFFDLDLNA